MSTEKLCCSFSLQANKYKERPSSRQLFTSLDPPHSWQALGTPLVHRKEDRASLRKVLARLHLYNTRGYTTQGPETLVNPLDMPPYRPP